MVVWEDDPEEDGVDVLAEMEETERRVLHNVLSAPWEQSADDVTRWEELLEHAAQTRIRLQQAREERLEREEHGGKTSAGH